MLLKQLLNTRHRGVEHIGDVLGPSSLFARLSAILKTRDSASPADLRWYAPADQNRLRQSHRNRDHLTDNGTFTHDVRIGTMFAALGVFFDNSAR